MRPSGAIDLLGRLFHFRPSAPRWKIATRSALSLGIPVAAGWAAGNLSAGLVATIGAFTAVYGSGRPYSYRAIVLCGIALAFTSAACLGAWTRNHPMLSIPIVAAVAMTTTFLCNTLRIGPPGAYMFALACAVGTAIPASHFALWQVALFVLAGGATSWTVQMLGVFVDPRAPETAAVVASARAVAAFAKAARGPEPERACDDAARALHNGWVMLVSLQPATAHPDERLIRLRALNRELHLLFAACVNAADQPGTADLAIIANRALEIVEAAKRPSGTRETARRSSGTVETARRPCGTVERDELSPLPLGHLDIRDSIRESLRLGSPALETTLRVGVAVFIAGGIGSLFGLQRTYWAMAAAVLVLHEGSGWKRAVRRGAERTAGTLASLGFVAVLLALHPGAAQLVGTLVVLQFATEMLVTRNYALAAVFITAIALLVGTGGQEGTESGRLLWTRGQETVIGCLTGVLVYGLTAPGRPGSIRKELARTIEAINALIERLAHGEFLTPQALIVRRDLQHVLIALVTRFETQLGGTPRSSEAAARLWPAVAATLRLGYKVLATCWSAEAARGQTEREKLRALAIPADFAMVNATLGRLADALSDGAPPLVLPELPSFVHTEIVALNSTLVGTVERSQSIQRVGRDGF